VEEKKHAKFSPSNMGMFEKCPGYRNRTLKNQASERGDRIHDALEHDKLDELPEEEKAVAQICKDYIDSILANHLPKLPDVDIREYTVDVDLGNDIKTFGTFDRFLLYGDTGWMFDYKSGYLEVADAEYNAQGWTYSIGLFQKYPELQTLTVTFLIPNRDEVSSHTFTRADIPRMTLRLNTIVRRAMELDDEGFFWSHPDRLNPQPELCEYCSRQTTCPALASKHLQILKDIAPGLPVPSDLRVQKSRPQDIAHLMRLAPLMEDWAAKIRSEALKVNLEEGIDIPGFNRFERSLPRSVTSVLGTWQAVQNSFGDKITLEDFLANCGSVSIPKLEDMLAEKAKHGEKGKIREEFMDELRGADVLNEGGKIFYLRESKK
jgi:hypothetical protein